jgi:hypothetical protein
MARVGISNDYYGTGEGTTDYYGSAGDSTYIPALYSKKVLRN